MIAIIGALAPIFLLILFGQALRRGGLVPESAWGAIDRLNYYVFFPSLIVDELTRARLTEGAVGPMAASMIGGVLAAAALMLAVRRWLGLGDAAFGSVFQGSMRPNTYVGLASAKALFGPAGLTLAAVGIAVVVPLVNVLCVTVLARLGSRGGAGWGAVAGGLVRNPIILAAALGASLSLGGVGRVPVAADVVEILARAALPIGLLSVGAGLDLWAARAAGTGVAVSSAVKLLLVPGITAGIGVALGLPAVPLVVAVLFNALPCSASAYALARQMGGDHGLIAGIITVQTLLAALTLPLVVALAL